MAKKKARKASGSEWKPSWKTETAGFQPELRGLGFRLSGVVRAGQQPTDAFESVCRTLFPILLNLLGDHMVELDVGRPTRKAWEINFAFRQHEYGQSAELRLSELVKPETWVRMAELFDGGIGALTAFRGGGALRHEVWSIGVSQYMHFAIARDDKKDVWTLNVAAEHIEPLVPDWWHAPEGPRAHTPLSEDDRMWSWQGLIETFFSAVSVLPGFIRGEGGLVRRRSCRRTFGDEVAQLTSDEQMLAHLRVLLNTDDLAIVLPSAATVLGPEQCQRLGGADEIVAKAQADLIAGSEQCAWGDLRVMRIQSSVLIQFSDVTAWVDPRGGTAVVASFNWVMSLLRSGGLLVQVGPAVSKSAEEYVSWKRSIVERNRAEDAALRQRGDEHELLTPTSAALPTSRPACVRSASSIIEDCPDKELAGGGLVCWRVRPREGPVDAGLTVYARHSAELGQLIAPVLVGSLDAERAALAFHPRVHGYDAMCEAAESPEGKRREASYGRLKQAVCKGCQSRVFHVWAALEYPDDLEEGDVGAEARVEEWFSWFWLVTRCASCGEVQTVVDHECA